MMKKLISSLLVLSLAMPVAAEEGLGIYNQISGAIGQQQPQNAAVNQAQLQMNSGTTMPAMSALGGVSGKPSRMYGAELCKGVDRGGVSLSMNTGYVSKEGWRGSATAI